MRAVLLFLILFSTESYAPDGVSRPLLAPFCPLHAATTDYSLNPFPPTYEVAWKKLLSDRDNERTQIIIEMLKRNGHEARLLRALDFEWDEGKQELRFPTFHRMLVLFDGVAGQGLDYGIPHLRPGLLYRTRERMGTAVGVGRAVEPGWEIVDIQQMSGDEMGWMVHNRYIPLSLRRLLHDFFHVFAVAAYRGYAAGIYDLRIHFFNVRGLLAEDKARRFAFFYEAFANISDSNRRAVLRMLGAPFIDGNLRDLTLDKLLDDERDIPIETIRRSATQLIREHHPYVTYMGAAGREVGAPVSSILYERSEFLYESIPVIARRLWYALNDTEFFGRKLDVRTEYQRFRLALYYSIGMTATHYVRAATDYEPLDDRHPEIYRYFIHSGIGTGILNDGRDGMMFRNFSSPRPSRGN